MDGTRDTQRTTHGGVEVKQATEMRDTGWNNWKSAENGEIKKVACTVIDGEEGGRRLRSR